MPVAQVISFSERQPMGRARRAPQQPGCTVLQFPSLSHRATMPLAGIDAVAGRGRDPG
jgi:hypothetical protein